jgi:hypothetical protein
MRRLSGVVKIGEALDEKERRATGVASDMKCRRSKSSPGRFLRGDRLNGKARDDEEIR